MLWDCPSCGAKAIDGETCPTCGSPQPSSPSIKELLSRDSASATPDDPTPKRPWTVWRIVYNLLAFIGAIALLPLSSSRSRQMDSYNIQEDSASMMLYALIGSVIVVGAIILGMGYLTIKNQAARDVSSTQSAVVTQRPLIMAEMKKHLVEWQAAHDTVAHRVTSDQLALDANIHLVEVDYGYCDTDHFYAYAITSMQGSFEVGAYGTLLGYTSPTGVGMCAPKRWITVLTTKLEDGWFEAQFAVVPSSTATQGVQ